MHSSRASCRRHRPQWSSCGENFHSNVVISTGIDLMRGVLKSKAAAGSWWRIMRFVQRNVELEQAGACLEKVLAGSMRRAPRNEAPVLAWPLVCGSAVAERTRAVSFAAGILHVEVADTGWKRELQALAPRYVAMINRYSVQTVSRIEFVVAAHDGVVNDVVAKKDAGGGARATSEVPGIVSFRTGNRA